MKNTFGSNIKLTLFGESHGEAIGAVLDGLPAGLPVNEEYIASCMRRRAAYGKISTARQEADAFSIVSGVYNGRTTGSPITAIIKNTEKGVMYLELQSSRENGWKYFASDGRTTSETLMKRFGARKTVDRQFGKVWEKEVVLAEVDSFKDNEEFRDILGYINTAKDKQKKGEGGYAK